MGPTSLASQSLTRPGSIVLWAQPGSHSCWAHSPTGYVALGKHVTALFLTCRPSWRPLPAPPEASGELSPSSPAAVSSVVPLVLGKPGPGEALTKARRSRGWGVLWVSGSFVESSENPAPPTRPPPGPCPQNQGLAGASLAPTQLLLTPPSFDLEAHLFS